MVELMPLPPIISCSSKIQNGLPFWCQLTQVVLEKRPLNGCSVGVVDSRIGHFIHILPSQLMVLSVFQEQSRQMKVLKPGTRQNIHSSQMLPTWDRWSTVCFNCWTTFTSANCRHLVTLQYATLRVYTSGCEIITDWLQWIYSGF